MRQFTRWSGAAADCRSQRPGLTTGSVTFSDAALADGGSGKVGSLKGVKAPLPDLTASSPTRLPPSPSARRCSGLQCRSDGQACASCHFHAGADSRVTNQLDPDERAVRGTTLPADL